MRENEFIPEIAYADKLGELAVDEKVLINNSLPIGKVDSNVVYHFQHENQHLYFFHDGESISASMLIIDGNIRAVKNFKNIPGAATALLGFLVHKLNLTLTVDDTEELTPDGFRWLKLLIKRNKGFTITDQNGNPVDVNDLEKEWNYSRITNTNGPTKIIFKESAHYHDFCKRHDDLLLSVNYWIGNPDFL